ncbi:hypothetical protein V6L77_06370 [Pannonibacter sp. Pt2-lr]|uniref:DUF2726 domain-containing protein n=1 Tax=Pannonibacter anstelovis TaxID=3121537 RepID=A0ABU7ZM66_9HYPH
MELALFSALFIMCFAMFFGVFYLMIKSRLDRAKAARITQENGSYIIPLVAGFSGRKYVPWLARSTNSINPKLVFHPDHVECKVIRTRTEPYGNISRVDYRHSIGTQNICFEFANSSTTFTGNTANKELTREAIALLKERGCPLSPRAKALLSEPLDRARGEN